MEAPSSYRAVGIPRNEPVDRLLSEPAGGEIAHRLRTTTAPRDYALGPSALRLERRERELDELSGDPAPLEVGPDQCIATAAPRQRSGPRLSQPLVVDIAGAHERLEYLVPLALRNP